MSTPTGELPDTPLRPDEQASIGVRLAASVAAAAGVTEDLALAEVRFAYRLTRKQMTRD